MDPRLTKQIDEHPYPLLFATISGAHLYGFPSPDSDYDLRGVHLLPLGRSRRPEERSKNDREIGHSRRPGNRSGYA